VIVLASASPRRRALLEAAGLAFRVEPADVDESLAGTPAPQEAARLLAERKALVVAERLRARPDAEPAAWVVGADTVVAVPDAPGRWTLLGKPGSRAEAAGMLRRLSDTRHAVVTGVAVVRTPELALSSRTETTHVTMRPIEEREVSAYVASGEWEGKAGGYAIQETADAFVVGLEEGGFDNVVGLPVALTLALLAEAGAPGLTGSLADPEGRR
jgi:septum formation protein